MAAQKLKGRYEIKETLGQGGMGVVYKAYDLVVKRDVAVKTLRDATDGSALQLFQRECEVLASISHPNIVEIFDIGELEERGERRPFFVMPLLPGMALDKLIHDSSHRLTVERSVEIITQACRGLHAAHEAGLVHRDIKPSNIFVMKDDSVKIIDFGVALMVDSRVTRGQKGTLLYMSPEQIEMKPLSALSDIFSLGVVCYETLTSRRPFEKSTEADVVEAILRQIPPPASELNPAVSQGLSRVVHKAIAKQPWHRFTSAREFAETLGKALRNEPIEFFDPSRIQPRVQRARTAFEQADYQFAAEIVSELEAEGHIDPEISQLRRQIDQAVRQKTVRQLLENARTRFEQDEYPLALQKIQEVLQLDPDNAAALGLKSTLENKRAERKIEDWFRLAHQHTSNHAYGHARQALQNVLQLRPKESRALQLLAEVDRREQEYLKIHQEKEQTYKAALEAWQNGEISEALSRMGVVLELERRSPDTTSPERTTTYQNFYNRARSEHDAMNNAHVEARKHLADGKFAEALALCDKYLAKYPGNALLQALKFDVEEQQRQERSTLIAEIDRRVEAEPDLVKRVSILEEVLGRCPGEAHFERALRLMREKRDLVSSIVAKARLYEDRAQFVEALGQWEILRTIYRQFPGLEFETERVVKRRDQQARIDSRTRWTKQIDQQLQWGDYARAIELVKEARTESPDDPELAELEKQAHQGMERAAQVQGLLAQGQELCGQHRFEEGIEILRKAHELDPANSAARSALSDALAERAHGLFDIDWHAAETLVGQALEIDPDHALAKSLYTLASDRKRQEFVDQCLSQARQAQATGDVEGARAVVERGLATYPQETRLTQRHATLKQELLESQQRQSRRRDFQETAGSDPAASGRRLETFVAPKAAPPSPPPPRQEPVQPRSAPSVRAVPAAPAPVVPAEVEDMPEPGKKAGWILVAGGAVVIIIVGVFVAVRYKTRPPQSLQGPPLAVGFSTSPPGARIQINHEDRGTSPFRLELPEGTYQVDALKSGYQPASRSVTVKRGSADSIDLALQPLAQVVQLSTDLDAGEVWLDGRRTGKIQEGQDFVLDSVDPGKHSLRVASRRGEAAFDFEVAPAAMAVLSGPVKAKRLKAVVVTNLGNQARLQSSTGSGKISVDGKPAEDVGSGLELNDLAPGNHDLILGEGKDQEKIVVETGPTPRLSMFLNSHRNAGAPVVQASKARRAPAVPAAPAEAAATTTKETQIARLNESAYQAFIKGNYAGPEQGSAIAYSQQVLQLDPHNDYANKMIESSVTRGKDLAQHALGSKDFATARRAVNALATLLPGRKDVQDLQKDITVAEKANQTAPGPAPVALVSFRVKHLHAQPAGSYCEGILSVSSKHLKFAGKPASNGKVDNLEIACSDIRDIKKHTVLHFIGQSGFHVEAGSGDYSFVPEDASIAKVISGLRSACSK